MFMTENVQAPVDDLMDGRERCVFYARYSNPRQRRASIEGQNRNCQEAADEKGWRRLREFDRADEAKTGVTLLNKKHSEGKEQGRIYH
jgi:hypothetical protein